MKRTIISALVVGLAWCVGARASETTDREAIQKRIAQFDQDWAKHDLNAIASFWSESGDMITPDGEYAKGREAVLRVFSEKFKTVFKDSTHNCTVKKIQFLTPDLALVDLTTHVVGMHSPEGQLLPEMTGRAVLVMSKKDNQWWFSHARPGNFLPVNAASQPMPVSHRGMLPH